MSTAAKRSTACLLAPVLSLAACQSASPNSSPTSAPVLAAGQKLVIPFEAITINSGVLDAQAKAIVLHLNPDRLQGAPTFPVAMALFPNSWEQSVRDHWQRMVRVVSLKDNGGLFLLPLAKTNIPQKALEPGAKIELVLLADNNRLAGAPRIAADQATDGGAQSAARGYWGQ